MSERLYIVRGGRVEGEPVVASPDSGPDFTTIVAREPPFWRLLVVGVVLPVLGVLGLAGFIWWVR